MASLKDGKRSTDFRDASVEMKLEIVVIPVSDVDRAKEFYGGLGWRLAATCSDGTSRSTTCSTTPSA